jgi:hypothetical protein
MPNFKIVPLESDFQIVPLTEIAGTLVTHCHDHGDDLTYPTWNGAEAMISRMDTAVENRQGRPWQVFR